MAKTLIGSLEVRLIDKMSAQAKQAAQALGGLKSAADALGSGAGKLDALSSGLKKATADAEAFARAVSGAKWGANFNDQLSRLKVSPEEIRRLQQEYARLRDAAAAAMKAGAPRADIQNQLRAWKNGALQEVVALRQVQQAANTLTLREQEAANRKKAAVDAETARKQAQAEREATRQRLQEERRAYREAQNQIADERRRARDAQRAEDRQAAQERVAQLRQEAEQRRTAVRQAARADADARRAERDATRRAERADAASARAGQASARHLAGSAAVALGVGASSYQGARAARYATTQGAESAREDVRIRAQGATPEEAAMLARRSAELSAQYRSLDGVQIREMGRNLLGNTGSYEKAMEVLPAFARARVALQTIVGPQGADGEMEQMSRAIDLLGHSRNVDSTRRILDGYLRARQVDSRAVTGSDFVNFAQTGGAAARSFSVDFLTNTLPALIAQQRGHRTGTDFVTAYRNFIEGRGRRETVEEQQRFLGPQAEMGLRQGVQRGRGGRITNAGNLVDEALYASNPYEWAKKHLLPRLISQGVMPEGYARGDYSQDLTADQRTKLTRALGRLFSDRRGSSIFSLMLGDMGQIESIMERQRKAMGDTGVERNAANDPFVQWEAVNAQLRNAAQEISKPILTTILPALNQLAGGLNSISQFARDNPGLTTAGLGLGAAGGLYGAYRALSGGFGLGAAAVALKGAAAALTASAGARGLPGALGGAAAGAAGSAAGAAAGGAAAGAAGSRAAQVLAGAAAGQAGGSVWSRLFGGAASTVPYGSRALIRGPFPWATGIGAGYLGYEGLKAIRDGNEAYYAGVDQSGMSTHNLGRDRRRRANALYREHGGPSSQPRPLPPPATPFDAATGGGFGSDADGGFAAWERARFGAGVALSDYEKVMRALRGPQRLRRRDGSAGGLVGPDGKPVLPSSYAVTPAPGMTVSGEFFVDPRGLSPLATSRGAPLQISTEGVAAADQAQLAMNQITANAQAAAASMGAGVEQALVGGIQRGGAAFDSLMERMRAQAAAGIDVQVRVNQVGGMPSGSGAPAGATPAAPARASGGSVYAGELYRINEHRTEFFRPASDGYIDPQGGGGGALALGGGAPPINLGGIQISTGGRTDPEQVLQMVTQHLRESLWEHLSAALSDSEYANG